MSHEDSRRALEREFAEKLVREHRDKMRDQEKQQPPRVEVTYGWYGYDAEDLARRTNANDGQLTQQDAEASRVDMTGPAI